MHVMFMNAIIMLDTVPVYVPNKAVVLSVPAHNRLSHLPALESSQIYIFIYIYCIGIASLFAQG